MANNIIEILYTNFSKRLAKKSWDNCFNKLPEVIQGKINRYKRWQDRQAGLFGKLLLLEGLKKYSFPSDCLSSIVFDKYLRPYLDHNIDFNISHSDELVICAMTDAGRVGIDIERIKPINLSDFEHYMTSDQWENIKKFSNGYRIFYRYWTLKESVLKADGRGLSIPLLEVDTDGKKANLYESVWFLTELNVGLDYSCHLATNIEDPEIDIKEVTFK